MPAAAIVISGGCASAPTLQPYTEIVPGSVRDLDMLAIPGGTITIKDPENAGRTRAVEVGPFWIATYEITWDQYDPFVFEDMEPDWETERDADAFSRPSKPYIPPDLGFGHDGYPVISASFQGAEEFCKWLSFRTGRNYRLPTEAEWEWACRAGSDAAYSFGDDAARLGEFAWYDANSELVTHPVGEKKPNAWGLYDVHGNAGEWCVDLAGKPVILGGGQPHSAEQLRCEGRLYQDSSWNMTDPQIPKSPWWLSDCPFSGFRVIRVPD
ncbi:MAG: SUMF1/EgtB/PvdO family nonheme iron enzyme [Planctomycetes bacterium]|nr:SUMF1/EgtB/PvdO family nonheme iron enzyme [Planctomycetota bacterium]